MSPARVARNAVPSSKGTKSQPQKTDLNPRLVKKVEDLLEAHDDHARLLFQLEKFVSLVRFDPEDAKRDNSGTFEEWRGAHDLWESVDQVQPSRADRMNVRRIRDEIDRLSAERNAPELQEPKSAVKKVKKPAVSVLKPKPAKVTKKKAGPSPTSRATRGPAPGPVQETAAPPKRKSSGSSVKRRMPETRSPKRAKTLARVSRGGAKAAQDSDSDLDSEFDVLSDSDSSESNLDTLPDSELPQARRVNLTFSVPKGTVAHPSHVVKESFGGSLSDLLDSFKLLEEDPISIESWNEYVEAEAETLQRVNRAKDSGLLSELEQLGAGQEEQSRYEGPRGKPTFWDNFVSQATYYSKIRANYRKAAASNTRKSAQSVEWLFRRLAGAEEKERKDQERMLRQIAKKMGMDVLKKWKLAAKVVEQRRQKVLYEENKVKGKEYLNQILEQSAQLLESRVDSYAPEDDTDFESDAPSDSVTELQQPTPSDSEAISQDSDQFSDSDDGDNEEEEDNGGPSRVSDSRSDLNDDLSMPIEQLRLKYGSIEPAKDSEATGDSGTLLKLEPPSAELLRLYEEEPDMGGESSSLEEFSSSEFESEDQDQDDESALSEKPRSLLGSLFGASHESDSEGDYRSDVSMQDVTDALDNEESGQNDSASVDSGANAPTVRFETPTRGLHKLGTPALLRGKLREYQRDGLDWLAGLYNTQSNGILADEMGLGKTIQTISLLSYLACEKHVWGPHLIIVPTSVMLNWEMEFKRFAPGFKVLTYYGTPQQRKEKRRGWNKEDTWHVCITSYQLVIQDQVAFKRKRWRYMILDEAHNIKNFRSQRWQALLNFNSERRLLLTGTPLQNNLVELWSLLYFLMPSSRGSQMMPDGFANLEDFQEWFARPVDQMVEEGTEADDEAKATISKLHTVLRPYLLRRLKADVEKQMPGKYEHVIYTKLSKRQRYLYDDFMSRAATKETFAAGNFMSILNCLMQLRKVCNHPDLFEVRPIKTSLALQNAVPQRYQVVAEMLDFRDSALGKVDLNSLNLCMASLEDQPKSRALVVKEISADRDLQARAEEAAPAEAVHPDLNSLENWASYEDYLEHVEKFDRFKHELYLNRLRTSRVPLYGTDLRQMLEFRSPIDFAKAKKTTSEAFLNSSDLLRGLVHDITSREMMMRDEIARYSFVTPAAVCVDCPGLYVGPVFENPQMDVVRRNATFHDSQVRLSIAFPDKRLLQYDCGKLQRMSTLLRDLIAGGHRVLIFTQMTKVLDILEQFLNIHGWRYLRLDGATRVEERQIMTERFNRDSNIPVFILSTRSGGLGINLTGADTVIFYDSDWNPAMDKQCQDRCHRIGQTRDVHIYRLVSEFTIESNILRKATQKTILDNVVIQDGDFTTDFFNKVTVQDLLGDNLGRSTNPETLQVLGNNIEALAQTEDADDAAAATVALSETRLDAEEFEPDRASVIVESKMGSAQAETAVEAEAEDAADRDEPSPHDESVEPRDGSSEPDTPEEYDGDEIGHVDDYMIKFIERGDFGDL